MFSFKTSPEMMNPRYFALIQSRKAGKTNNICLVFRASQMGTESHFAKALLARP